LILLFKLGHHELALLLEMGLLVDGEAHNATHGLDLVAQEQALLQCLVSLLSHYLQTLFCLCE